MKMGNGMGGISKLSGNRRRPYCAKVTDKWIYDEEKQKKKQIQKVIGYYRTKKEALEALVLYNRNPYDLDGKQVTFDEIYKQIDFVESNRSNYKAAYKYLLPVSEKAIRSITPAQLQDCIESCKTGQQPLIKTICKRVYNFALMHEYTDKDISQYLTAHAKETQIVRTLFTHDEVEELWQLRKQGHWWANVTLILLFTGMRTKELRDLTADDIDLDEMTVNIRIAKNKSSVRKIPIHTHAEPYFRAYKEEGIGFYGKTHNGFNKAIQRSFETEHHAHDTRHTFATKMRECGCDPLILQKILGHTPQTITERVYTHLTLEEMRQNIEKLKY